MKKALMILALLATGMCASAQIDTLHIGDREPTYYYWDTNWWDHYFTGGRQWNSTFTVSHEICKSEVARYCYVDTSLRVIGIAAAIDILFNYNNPPLDRDDEETILNRMVPEYLRLYEVDSLTDEMILIDQVEWTNKLAPRHKIAAGYYPGGGELLENLYELYFDSAITVHDSFYVAMTGNNNYRRENYSLDLAFALMIATKIVNRDSISAQWGPKPYHFRRKMHLLNNRNYDYFYGENDTNWHIYFKNFNDAISPATIPALDLNQYMCIFPIIDTSRIIPPPACHTPNGLTTVYAEAGVATLMWSGGNADHWELSLCTDGCEPEEGSITQWNSLAATLQGLDTAQWYEARVRAVCSHDDSIYYSDWSDSLRFYMPGSNGGSGGGTDPTGIETTADRYTYVMPNPASGNVTVASSFRIGDVELLDLNGKSHLRTTVDGLSAALDISSLPAGTYIVRITTSAGTAYKKLVVK